MSMLLYPYKYLCNQQHAGYSLVSDLCQPNPTYVDLRQQKPTYTDQGRPKVDLIPLGSDLIRSLPTKLVLIRPANMLYALIQMNIRIYD